MALWICTGCTCRYSVGAAGCPQCGSTEYVEEGAEDMAKITVHGGPSNAAADEQEAGEDVSAGSSSETSSEKEPSSPETSDSASPSRARTTGSRSKKARTESSSASGTAGGPAADTSATDSADK
ncbi:MAG TPA: hypothetical protein VNO54_30205 [Streptosporangiaceae bacterium]|nr:hypothetical protein [Streptosporangiaceae bacterium]